MEVQEARLHLRALDPTECEQILARNHVGRLAYARHKQIDIQPVHYILAEGWIYARGPFAETHEIVSGNAYGWQPVALEVDEVDDLFNWRYVVVHGGFYLIDRERSSAEAAAWQHGVELLQRLVPEAFRAHDPAPDRTVLFRISAQDLSGQAATAAAGA